MHLFLDLQWASPGPLLDFSCAWTATGPRLGLYWASTKPQLDLYWTPTRFYWTSTGHLTPQELRQETYENCMGRSRDFRDFRVGPRPPPAESLLGPPKGCCTCYWTSNGPRMDLHWTPTRLLLRLDSCGTSTGPLLGLCWASTGPLLDFCWTSNGHLTPRELFQEDLDWTPAGLLLEARSSLAAPHGSWETSRDY